jgi:hypothetical protein
MPRKITKSKKRPPSPATGRARVNKEKIASTLAALDEIKPKSAKAARAIALFKSWLADESGYDERVWPRLKESLDKERQRVGARRLFDG